MKIWPHDSTKETGWGSTKVPEPVPHEIFSSPPNMHCFTLILKSPTKELKPMHASLFDLLPSGILVDIGIWLSDLKYCNKCKHAILRFKYMSNPILFAIIHNLWTPYHNVGSFYLYKKVQYDWAHRHITARA